ncbi:MAG: TolC family protein, partial [Pseudomonadota bacterium]
MSRIGSYWLVSAVVLFAFGVMSSSAIAGGLTLNEAVRLAVQHHPRVAEAAAQRRIADAQLRQQTGRFLPTLDVSGFLGEQFVDRPNSLSAQANANWQSNKQFNSTAQLVLFDGFDRANAVYGQIARINASAIRVLEQSELVALETVEAYLDVMRHRRILDIARQSIATHQSYLSQIQTAFAGGRAPSGDVAQARERLAAVRTIVGDVQLALGVVEAKFINLVGRKPGRLRGVNYPKGIPRQLQ